MCANTKNDLRYEAGCDDRGLDISTFAYGMDYTPCMCHRKHKGYFGEPRMCRNSLGTRRPKGQAWVKKWCD
jgi:hypothetical protein